MVYSACVTVLASACTSWGLGSWRGLTDCDSPWEDPGELQRALQGPGLVELVLHLGACTAGRWWGLRANRAVEVLRMQLPSPAGTVAELLALTASDTWSTLEHGVERQRVSVRFWAQARPVTAKHRTAPSGQLPGMQVPLRGCRWGTGSRHSLHGSSAMLHRLDCERSCQGRRQYALLQVDSSLHCTFGC